jgi:plasmid stabilization system protein ParE
MVIIKLTPAADSDLLEIWGYTDDRWGAEQADTYLRKIDTRMTYLGNNPKRGKKRTELPGRPIRTWEKITWTCRSQSSVHLWTHLNRKKPQHSSTMPRFFLNRSVQIWPKSCCECAQVIFSQVLSYHEGRHVIFYRPITTGREVIRILHDGMDFSRHLWNA